MSPIYVEIKSEVLAISLPTVSATVGRIRDVVDSSLH
jgi:hypothetical protein